MFKSNPDQVCFVINRIIERLNALDARVGSGSEGENS
jgi:hypothetical protein